MRQSGKIAAGLQDLETLDRAALAARWEALMKRAPPKAASRVFLLKALTFELQSKHAAGLSKADLKALSGGLSKAVTVAADHTAVDAAVDNTDDIHDTQRIDHIAAAGLEAKPTVKRKRPASVKLVPGARLVREWNGRTYTVSVIDEGFVYKNRTWTSLSAIAKDITGAHWSGPRFFGMDKAA